MAGGQLRAAIRDLLQIVSSREGGGLTDGQLLESFVCHQDEAAFETLLWRHGPMVLRTCQRILRNPQDAEDAFQATFLQLCRHARAIGRRDSVGSWLHRVAYRAALKAKAARRLTLEEARLAEVPARESATEPNLRPLLDEELSRLPERYRAPLVLHYLEGKTVEQTAQELGWRPGTVAGRLARARQVLRGRLGRRGVVLTGGLLAGELAVGAGARACPTTLVGATVKAAATAAGPAGGGLLARLLALARLGLRTTLLTRLKVAGGVCVLLALVAAGAGLVRRATAPAPASGAGTAAADPTRGPGGAGAAPAAGTPVRITAAPDGSRRLSVTGRVVAAGGGPVAGATVRLREWALWRDGGQDGRDVLATTATDEAGRFAFVDVRAPAFAREDMMQSCPWDVIATADGHGLAWCHLAPPSSPGPLTLTLRPEGRVRGRLRDAAGKPVAGARVRVLTVCPLRSPYVPLFQYQDGVLNLQWSAAAPAARSDAAGAFEIAGLPEAMRCSLEVFADGYVMRTVLAATADGPQPSVLGTSSSGDTPTVLAEPVRTGSWDLALERSHRLRGRVLYGDSGRPVAGASVWVGNAYSSWQVTTDSAGDFVLGGLPAGGCPVSVRAPESGGDPDYLGVRADVELAPAQEETRATVRLPRGTPVSGTVVDADTGEAVEKACVTFRPPDGAAAPGPLALPWVRTGPGGRFRLAVPAGRGSLFADGLQAGYAERVELPLRPRPGRPLEGIRVALHRGLVVHGTVLDRGGNPVAGARARLEAKDGPGQACQELRTDARGEFTARNVQPNPQYEWVVVQAGRGLGGRAPLSVAGYSREPVSVTIRLEPLGAVEGRVLDGSGRPLPGASVGLWAGFAVPHIGRAFAGVDGEETRTGPDGRFRFSRLLPDPRRRYTVEASGPGLAQTTFPEVEARSGRTQILPDVVLVPAAARVAGVVVDAKGRPLADVQVTAVPRTPWAAGPASSRPALAVTAGDGRFTLSGLPPGRCEVEAELYVAGAEVRDGRYGPSTRVVTETGRGDVRIVLPAPDAKRASRN